ncbi:hypothetical protein MPL3356_110067 [Mesorhizobium plurifarium]|uniref:Uncharacterized protein n=1 Tax=Mesorhizobium plurifarium TaxID=69974 RepID=A0A090D9I6_MESPL|nr:hypothetical protein MPL3356_110067 [Mesorhizobium plurifarium]
MLILSWLAGHRTHSAQILYTIPKKDVDNLSQSVSLTPYAQPTSKTQSAITKGNYRYDQPSLDFEINGARRRLDPGACRSRHFVRAG